MSRKGKDCVAVFYETLSENAGLEIAEVMAIASKKPAPRFYVNFHEAQKCVSLLDRNLDIPRKKRNSVLMYKELQRRLHEKQQETGIKTYAWLQEIIESPAPSFYLEYEAFRCLVYRTIRESKLKNRQL